MRLVVSPKEWGRRVVSLGSQSFNVVLSAKLSLPAAPTLSGGSEMSLELLIHKPSGTMSPKSVDLCGLLCSLQSPWMRAHLALMWGPFADSHTTLAPVLWGKLDEAAFQRRGWHCRFHFCPGCGGTKHDTTENLEGKHASQFISFYYL